MAVSDALALVWSYLFEALATLFPFGRALDLMEERHRERLAGLTPRSRCVVVNRWR